MLGVIKEREKCKEKVLPQLADWKSKEKEDNKNQDTCFPLLVISQIKVITLQRESSKLLRHDIKK